MQVDIKEAYNCQIWLGLKNIKTGITKSLQDVYDFIEDHCYNVGECLTITPTRFIYTKGFEDGVIIGFINYPRFPKDKSVIESNAINLATKLMFKMEQCRVSITTPDRTYMLTNNELVKNLDNE